MFFLTGCLMSLALLALTPVSADLDSIVAVPRDRHNTPQTNQTDKAIKALLGDDKVYSYISPYQGVSFWLAPMTSDQQDKVKKLPGVSNIWKDDPNGLTDDSVLPRIDLPGNKSEYSFNDLHKREGGIKHRSETTNNIEDDLKLVSWAPGKAWNDVNDYAFDEVEGTDTWIYLIENGVNLQNLEISGNAPEKPFFYGPKSQPTDTDSSSIGHGTCMASKAGGPTLGVASKAHIIVVKTQSLADSQWAFEQARDDIVKQGRQGKSVVLFARGPLVSYPGQENESPWKDVKPVLQDLFANDVVIVTSSGNLGEVPGHENVDTPPKIWAAEDFPLIVVGAVDTQGKIALNPGKQKTFSQGGPKVTVWAPGKDVICASHISNDPRKDTGTSPASAMTAGLVAYFLSFRNNRPFPVGGGNTATNARNYLRDIARWQRPGGQNNAIWNMVDSLNAPVAQTATNTPTPAQPAITPSCTNTRRTNVPDDYHIEVHGMTGDVLEHFGTNRLSKLFVEENGCGGSNSWTWIWDNNEHTVGSVTFNMPLGMKGGCVERAFMTAAKGPQLGKCVQKHSG